MNTKQFAVLFMSAATIVSVQGFGTLEAIALNGALTLPLLGATAGTFGTALAVLGALKLGAVALFLASMAKAPQGGDDTGYGYTYRSKRAASSAVSDPDAVFGLISSMDLYGCGKQLVCELEAKSEGSLESDEMLLLTLFADRKTKKFINPGSAKAEYDLAAELGMASKDQVICRHRYSTCPYTADEMMDALRQSHI